MFDVGGEGVPCTTPSLSSWASSIFPRREGRNQLLTSEYPGGKGVKQCQSLPAAEKGLRKRYQSNSHRREPGSEGYNSWWYRLKTSSRNASERVLLPRLRPWRSFDLVRRKNWPMSKGSGPKRSTSWLREPRRNPKPFVRRCSLVQWTQWVDTTVAP